MKKYLLINLCAIALLLLSSNSVYSQISDGGIPVSFDIKTIDQELTSYNMRPFNVQQMLDEDALNEKTGTTPFRFAKTFDVNYTPDNSGTLDHLPNGDKIWRIAIKSDEAHSLNFIFGRYHLPEGAKLFIYNKDKSEIIGAFTSKNNKKTKTLPTSLIPGDIAIIEYYEPNNAEFEGELMISKVNHDYKGIINSSLKDGAYGTSGDCNIDINCPTAADWQTEKHAVCRILMSGYFCTGTLVNNTAQNGTPYFLTANHCTGPDTPYDEWIFYFNYENPTCNETVNPNTINNKTIASCEVKATISTLDFCLVEMSSTPPEDYEPYYAGWNRSETPAMNTVGIHHPSGDVKKYCVDYESPIVANYGGNWDTNSHWLIQQWDEESTTEGGSSGSALFDENHRIVGDLTGGEAVCGNNVNDFYAMFHRSWDDYASTSEQLKHWLDPSNSGVETLNGFDPYSTGVPTANFNADQTNVLAGTTVNFSDLTTGNPTSWNWTFNGGTPANSTLQNPSVTYNAVGLYPVTLTATNSEGSDTETRTDYINVYFDELTAQFTADNTVIALDGEVNFTDISSGTPTSWNWIFEGGTPETSTDQNPGPITYSAFGTYPVTLTVTDADSDTDIEIKPKYITVEEPTYPVADFMANQTTMLAGTTINYTDLSTGFPSEWYWTFEGGTPETSTEQNPIVTYNTEGTFNTTLVIFNGIADSLTKEGYILVINEDDITEAPITNFTTPLRLFPVGSSSICYTDLSTNNPTSWSWTFEGGTPVSSTEQHPCGISYNTPGGYSVTLTTTNIMGSNTLTKTKYIIISDFPMDEFCDTITNKGSEEYYTINTLTGNEWGYIPGHNSDQITAYADYFQSYTYSQISGLRVWVSKSSPSTSDRKVKFNIWADGDVPGEIIGSKFIDMNTISSTLSTFVIFDDPIEITDNFYAGFEVNYFKPDTFASYMVIDRGNPELNTMYVEKNFSWMSAYDYYGISTSLGVDPIACLVDIDEIDLENNILIFPNPSNGNVIVDFGDYAANINSINVYDISGRRLNIQPEALSKYEYQLDFNNYSTGIYFVNLLINNKVITKKVSIIK